MSVINSEGLILKSVAGLFTVEVPDGIFECKARGIFRKDNISPYAGDRVIIETDGREYVISEILPRKNEIIRPPMANLDCMFFVVSTCEPEPSFLVLDKFLAVCEYKKINSAVVITKNDLKLRPDIKEIYEKSGFPVFTVDYGDKTSYIPILDMIKGKICAFTGNTGAGKSTLLNHLEPSLSLSTSEISKKLGRGRHTTRQVELYKLPCGGYIADTPGFSSFDTSRYDIIYKDKLKYCFPEFSEFEGKCRFPDCNHYKEKDCAVIEAVKCGIIPESRHTSYMTMFEEASKLKEWEERKK